MSTIKTDSEANMEQIGVIFDLIQQLVWRFGEKGFNNECCRDISLIEYMALREMFKTPYCPVQHVGTILGLTKSGATRLIDRLETRGYITRCHNSNDKRICCIELTSRGAEIFQQVSAQYMTYIAEILKELPTEKLDQIKIALALLVETANGHLT